MNIESKINSSENFGINKEFFKKMLSSEYFSVYCDSNIQEYLKSDDVRVIDDIKKFVDDTLKLE